MAYKYYNLNPCPPISASATLIEDFQSLLNDQFFIATDVFVVSEENPFASGSYVDLNVRINSAIDNQTGIKLGDDFKNFLFQDPNHPVDMGIKFIFDENFWVAVNTEKTKNLAASCMVRRANNVLRWMSLSGEYLSEPCVLDYPIGRPIDKIRNVDPVTPGGLVTVYAQLNDRTRTIQSNQRFLFGNSSNWVAYKITGGGINNFHNLHTTDNTSAQLLTLYLETHYVNKDTDDVILGIADKYGYTTSASSVANIVITPNDGSILESGSQIFDAHYYSGSTILSGSFVFTVSGSNVPSENYTLATIDNNTFSVVNNAMYLDYPLVINCSGSSGSRIFNIDLRGNW